MLRARRAGVVGLMIALLGAFGAHPIARAVPNDVDQDCFHHRRSFSFTWRSSVPAAQRSAINAGFADWSIPLDYNGARLFQWIENSSDPNAVPVDVSFTDLGPGTLGSANCTFLTVKISNRSEHQNLAALRNIARHEAGHIGGLEHTGRYDSHNNDNPPSMATCLFVEENALGHLTQEDASSITFAQTRLSNSSLTANLGFEQGISYWGLGGGGYAYVSSGGATGPGFIRYDAGNSTNSLFQTTRWVDAPAKHVTGTINHSKTAIPDVGTIRVELWARSVTYRSPNGSDCEYPNGKDMNIVDSLGTWARRTFTSDFTPSGTGWTKASTPVWTSFSTGEQDVRVRVYEDMRTYNGGVSSVRLDNVRVECDSQQTEGDCT